MIYGSKYEAILNAVAVPGRVCMEECFVDLIFLLQTDHLFFWVGGGGRGSLLPTA